jgi:hypothetical protein
VHVINLQANWYVSLPACSRPLAPLGSAALHGHLQLGSAGHGLRTAAGVSWPSVTANDEAVGADYVASISDRRLIYPGAVVPLQSYA